ncbi:hypothetical protein [Corynebacterium auriscanis]|uniref:Uncharacterized protein n=1 Tax=Corynebacterium auriscanis TaxID=99807 RepID=A0A0A2DG26_9CORY|nr:hypothetical protein [Corynebacterium auriscanis]KGM18133.1 hypothetical protein MA47_09520 [Corynebacterium auriscanis]WJY73197.1 hypothetical protein CAURIC_07910 [Corynebacterium auriscanis]
MTPNIPTPQQKKAVEGFARFLEDEYNKHPTQERAAELLEEYAWHVNQIIALNAKIIHTHLTENTRSRVKPKAIRSYIEIMARRWGTEELASHLDRIQNRRKPLDSTSTIRYMAYLGLLHGTLEPAVLGRGFFALHPKYAPLSMHRYPEAVALEFMNDATTNRALAVVSTHAKIRMLHRRFKAIALEQDVWGYTRNPVGPDLDPEAVYGFMMGVAEQLRKWETSSPELRLRGRRGRG